MRYLSELQIQAALDRSLSVEQLLLPAIICDAQVLRWIDLRMSTSGLTLTLYEVFDDGSDECLDVYSFEQVSPDEAPVCHRFSELKTALSFAELKYSAYCGRYVNAGVIQDEYQDYRGGQIDP